MSRNRAKLGNRKYKQGKYLVQNPQKYIGTTPVLYRSSWEYAFCKFCDMNENVIRWSAESLEIPYQITNGLGQIENHRYYPDFYVETIDPNNSETHNRLIIEIKPKSETSYPTPPKRQTLKMLENYEYSLKMFKKNLHKWSYTKEWCERRNLIFKIITEEWLKEKGLI